jgi:hypothetical protein
MATHKIIVEVNDNKSVHPTSPDNNTTPPTQPPKNMHPATSPGGLSGINTRQIITSAFMAGTARNVALAAINRIGETTGNYYLQSQINGTISMATYAAAAIFGGAAGLAFALSDIASKELTFQINRTKAQIRTNYYAEQIGISTYTGSRGRGRKI